MTDKNRANDALAELLLNAAHGIRDIADHLQAAADLIRATIEPGPPPLPKHLRNGDQRPQPDEGERCECGRPTGHGA